MTDVLEETSEALDIEREDEAPKNGKNKGKPKKEADKEIKLISLAPATVIVRLVGTTPLVVHQFSAKARQEMRDVQQKGAKRKKDPKVPESECDGARYKMEIADPKTGEAILVDAFPSMTVKKSLVSACRMMDGIPMTMVRQTVFVNRGQWLIPIERERGVYYTGDVNGDLAPLMREDIVRVGGRAGPGSGTADLRYRPEYDPWGLTCKVEFLPNVISPEQLLNLFRFAGFGCGIGENRPEKTGGDWGCFSVEDVKEIHQTKGGR